VGPDLFPFTDVVLDRSEAYRFAVSPLDGASWPPLEMPDWYLAIADASAGWCAWVEGGETKLPRLVAEEWAAVREQSAATLEELATGRVWRICQALLTLHAIADEACGHWSCGRWCTARRAPFPRPGTGTPGADRDPLADQPAAASGPPARAQPGRRALDSLPIALRLRPGPEVDAVWNRIPVQTIRPGGTAAEGNVLMLPWPLRIDAEDVKPAGAVEGAESFA
jgi:hypothetical protein